MKIISSYEYKELNRRVEEAEAKSKRLEAQNKTLHDTVKELKTERDSMKDKYELKEKQAVSAMEDKISKTINKLEQEHNKAITELEKTLRNEKISELEEMNKIHYKKLSDSMTKLHEEGNAQTKFMQETVQNVIKSASGFAKASNTHTQIEHTTEVTKER